MTEIHEDLLALADLVASAAFREFQEGFYAQYCHEFLEEGVDESTGNKLSYTQIHNDYIAQVEDQIAAELGQARLEAILARVEAYVLSDAHEKTAAIAEALNILSSMANFEEFKQTMLLKKKELSEGGGELLAVGGGSVILDVEDELNKCADLVDASSEGGWRMLTESEEISVWVKDGGVGKRFVRGSIAIDLPVHLCVEMMMMFGPEALEWNDRISSLEIISDFGPDDRIIEIGMKIPWVVKYMMSMPDKMCLRMVTRRNYPNPGEWSYLVLPYDRERAHAVEEMGPLKVKSGVVSPHPSGDANRSVVYSLDSLGTSMPEWGLAMLMKTMLKGEMKKRSTAFIKSSHYQRTMGH